MRKALTVFGLLFVTALLLVKPAKADSIVDYQLTGHGLNVTFSLPQTFTPSSLSSSTMMVFQNISGTLIGSSPYPFATIEIATSGISGVTDYWAFGSQTQFFALVAPGLFTINPDGTVTLNGGTFALGDYHLFYGGDTHDYTLTATVVDSPTGTPEPASLVLLGIGGLALSGLRRRKAA